LEWDVLFEYRHYYLERWGKGRDGKVREEPKGERARQQGRDTRAGDTGPTAALRGRYLTVLGKWDRKKGPPPKKGVWLGRRRRWEGGPLGGFGGRGRGRGLGRGRCGVAHFGGCLFGRFFFLLWLVMKATSNVWVHPYTVFCVGRSWMCRGGWLPSLFEVGSW
jgi:hypothetical protein